ncbi:MAG: hypothetical protein ACTHMC_28030 [Pseudobacter sp.]|uniref:hypothetical protein n=1 Tax=Pseudobacter sp. TaxID=2045420 RepID=UPI003F7D5384
MKRILYTLLILSVAATSCQKDISGELPDDAAASKDSYQPTSKGSYWKYRQTGLFAGDYDMVSTGQTQTIDGIVFTSFTNGAGGAASQMMLGKKGPNYYLRVAGSSPNSGAPFDLTQLYLNETEAVGFKWDFTGGHGNGFTAKTPGEIIEKGITLTVQGKTYKDVIHTRIKLQYQMPAPIGLMETLTYDYYVAKGVGMIRIDSEGDPIWTPGVSSTSELIEYSIK